jgi:fatty-acyl-CoA synthase
MMTEATHVTDFGIGSWARRRSAKSPDLPMILFEGEETTYGAFSNRVLRLAASLQRRGIRFGDRVAYLGDNHPSFLETMFASATLGAVFVPLNTRLAPAELAYALSDSGSKLLVFATQLAPPALTAAAAAGVGELIAVGSVESDSAEDFETVLADATPLHTEQHVALDDPAIILYTSGTTGRPKGAVLTHGNLTWNSINVLVDYDVTSTERALMVSPLFHVASLGMGALPIILKGATVVLERRFDAERVLSLIERFEITWMSGVPTTYQMLSDSPAWASTDLRSLRSLTCGGSPVPRRVIDAYEARGLSFTSGYGMTEASPGVTSLAARTSRRKAGSAGQSHFFTDIRIAEPDDRGVGEVQVRGPNVMTAYWHQPTATAEAFSADGWFRSGDLGLIDDEGFLTISDRLKDMVISGGENVYPAEVEAVISELRDVTGVAVIGAADHKWGEVPIAVITVRGGSNIGEAEVRSHLDGRLARYKIPKRVYVTEELPRTASGKVFKSRLREQFAAQLNDGI